MYANYCYNIEEMVNWNKKMSELYKERGFYKLDVKKQMKDKKKKKAEIINDPALLDKPTLRVNFVMKKELDLDVIQRELKDT